MTVTETRIHTQPDAMTWRNLTQLLQHIHRTGIYRHLQFMHARQRGVVNQIRSKDNRVWIGFRIKSGRQRTFDFTQRDRVNLDPCSRIRRRM